MAVIGVVGGTGKLGAALAGRWTKAGHDVLIGSRSRESAAATAKELSERFGKAVGGGTNLDVATRAEIVVCAVPWAAQEERLGEIRQAAQAKIVIDTTVPLMPPKVMRVQLPPEGSAALKARAILGEGVRLVSAFHNVAAHKLATDADVACDVLVFSDDKEARGVGVRLAKDLGVRGLHGGALANAAAAEALTSILIFLNKTYQVDGAGIAITGTLTEPA
ncbi:MAG TPA: NADPH-dependent F420 reductase [Sphingomonas sp.]|nr:NADPH-dependent F420 reductase [Sphingomonas sp.]